jgi:hypothetical protein
MIRSRLFKGTAATGGVALAACCAPLIVAPIVALFAAGGAGLAGFAVAGPLGLALMLAAAAGGYIWLRRRRRQARNVSCGCGPATPPIQPLSDNYYSSADPKRGITRM